ncbi:TetR family transcriptional regulator [Marinobacterium nitratireducens]|uniref:TetR family transcriptional regulator n=1 Tax=Marinobacterium nitratireducens TaxID=518897 RepID=A0A917Z9N2_9GAMM|nr:TetR/AcrR family transcriptional regulator [Marinobacterium nitratireducens]GGO76997.1 TetR family transcriptional regulator [Marinobacterium nitratireducens]
MSSKTTQANPSQASGERQRTARRIYGGRTSRERTQARRERLIFAALRLYGDAGFRTTTVRAICQEAGLTERYFYESFSNSEELLCAVCSWSMGRLRQLAREAVAASGADPAQRLRASTRAYFDYIQANPGHGRIALFEMEGTSRTTSDHLRAELDQTIELIVELHFEPLGTAPSGLQPELLARALLGATYQLAKEWLQSGFRQPSDTLALQVEALYAALTQRWSDAGR